MKKHIPVCRPAPVQIWQTGLCGSSMTGWQEKEFSRCPESGSAGVGSGSPDGVEREVLTMVRVQLVHETVSDKTVTTF